MKRWLDRTREYGLKYLLHWTSRRSAVRSAVSQSSLGVRGRRPPEEPPESMRVALVQVELSLVDSVDAYVKLMARPLLEAADGIDLVVYPEDVSTHLLGLLPGFAEVSEADSLEQALEQAAGQGVTMDQVFEFIGPTVRRVYRETFSALARRTRTHIVAGTAILPQGGRLYNVAHLFGPDGKLLGTQKKLHLIPLERQWGIEPGENLEIFSTALGKLGMPVCMDATYYEPFRIMEMAGVEVAAVPAANPEEYNVWKVLRGPWARAQEAGMFVLHACMVGRLAGLHLTGRSAVYAPVEMTPDGTGVLGQMQGGDQGGLLVCDLDLKALREFRKDNPRPRNVHLYNRYFPRLYDKLEPSGG